MLFRRGVLQNFAIFTAKHPCWILFLIKLQAWRPATLLKRDFSKIFKNTFFTEHLRWLLLQSRYLCGLKVLLNKKKRKAKTKIKTKMKNKMKTKTKIKTNLSFCVHFVFCFCFLKVFAFLLTPCVLEVPQADF